jgi:hypothetical protein
MKIEWGAVVAEIHMWYAFPYRGAIALIYIFRGSFDRSGITRLTMHWVPSSRA